MALIDMTGQRFGRLTVLCRDIEAEKLKKDRGAVWKCKCECGNYASVSGKSLRKGTTQSCGCLQKERTSKSNGNNLLNKRFGMLTVKQQLASKNQRTYWKCECDCGNVIEVCARELQSGDAISCGCWKTKQEVGNRYGKLAVIKQAVKKTNNGQTQWICQCDCGNVCTVSGGELRNGHVSSCDCLVSKGEMLIATLLSKMGLEFKRQYTFNDCLTENNHPCKFDFAIFKNNSLLCLIEYDGVQHFKDTFFWNIRTKSKSRRN